MDKKADVILGYYSGVFLLLCFLDHFLVATLFLNVYDKYLRRAQNPFRSVSLLDQYLQEKTLTWSNMNYQLLTKLSSSHPSLQPVRDLHVQH